MAQTKNQELQANCEHFAKTIEGSLPDDVGVIIILFNRRSGHTFMRAPKCARKQTDAIFKSLIERPGSTDNLIIPASRLM
jgi:hypothetical protein